MLGEVTPSDTGGKSGVRLEPLATQYPLPLIREEEERRGSSQLCQPGHNWQPLTSHHRLQGQKQRSLGGGDGAALTGKAAPAREEA